MSYERMPCSISDGPQTPEEEAEWEERWADIDPDDEFNELSEIEEALDTAPSKG